MISNGANDGAAAVEMTPEMLQEASDGLFMAAEHGRADVIKALIDHGQDKLDLSQVIRPDTGETPLHVAVHYRKTDAVRALLAAGFPPQIEAKDEKVNNNPMTRTSMSPKPTKKQAKHHKRTAYTLAKEMQMEEIIQIFHQFIVQQVATNDLNAVKRMLEAGIEVNISDGPHSENTLFHWAASCGATQVLEFLLSLTDTIKYDLLNKQNKDGATPLHEACHSGQIECVKLLLTHDANRNILGKKRYSEGKTALEVAKKQEIKDLFFKSLINENTKSNPKQKTFKEDFFCTSNSVKNLEKEGIESDNTLHTLKAHYEAQLEEKNLLIHQLKASIESLALESQEIQKLGEEKVVLGYIRKLREEKNTIQKQLVEAEEYICMQQEQMNQYKNQIRDFTLAIEVCMYILLYIFCIHTMHKYVSLFLVLQDLRTQVEVFAAEKAAKANKSLELEIQSPLQSNDRGKQRSSGESHVVAVTPLLVHCYHRTNSHSGKSNTNHSSSSISSNSNSNGTSSQSFWLSIVNLFWPLEPEVILAENQQVHKEEEKKTNDSKPYNKIEEEAIMTV
jgi:ankyrin repeat protein